MLLTLSQVLSTEVLNNVRLTLAKATYVDGKLSAGTAARQLKDNEEMDQGSQQADYLDNLLMQNLAAHADFRNAALPHQVSRPFFARYGKGMKYGLHIDDPIMGAEDGRFRTDIAVTVFISEPTDYEGGELEIQTSFGLKQIKLAAGDAVLYPASSLHQVKQIISGTRYVAVCWIQSLIRDPAKRELLYNLNSAREKLLSERNGSEESAHVDHAYTNLVRMWSEI